MTRTGTARDCAPYGIGRSRAAAAAHDKAVAAARQQWEYECEPVPCPACGLYQQAMVREARRRYGHWMAVAGRRLLFFLFIPVLLGVLIGGSGVHRRFSPAVVTGYLLVVPALVGLGVGLWGARTWLASRYDLNSLDVDQRKNLGRLLTTRA
jgi:hypothetical protein